jgi:hypothetical protein
MSPINLILISLKYTPRNGFWMASFPLNSIM